MSKSSRNLKLINAIVAMCRADSRWPHYFYDMAMVYNGLSILLHVVLEKHLCLI